MEDCELPYQYDAGRGRFECVVRTCKRTTHHDSVPLEELPLFAGEARKNGRRGRSGRYIVGGVLGFGGGLCGLGFVFGVGLGFLCVEASLFAGCLGPRTLRFPSKTTGSEVRRCGSHHRTNRCRSYHGANRRGCGSHHGANGRGDRSAQGGLCGLCTPRIPALVPLGRLCSPEPLFPRGPLPGGGEPPGTAFTGLAGVANPRVQTVELAREPTGEELPGEPGLGGGGEGGGTGAGVPRCFRSDHQHPEPHQDGEDQE